jgi:hypothetical protein
MAHYSSTHATCPGDGLRSLPHPVSEMMLQQRSAARSSQVRRVPVAVPGHGFSRPSPAATSSRPGWDWDSTVAPRPARMHPDRDGATRSALSTHCAGTDRPARHRVRPLRGRSWLRQRLSRCPSSRPIPRPPSALLLSRREEVPDADILPLVAATLDHDDPRTWYYGSWITGRLKKPCPTPRGEAAPQNSVTSRISAQLRARALRLFLAKPGTHGRVEDKPPPCVPRGGPWHSDDVALDSRGGRWAMSNGTGAATQEGFLAARRYYTWPDGYSSRGDRAGTPLLRSHALEATRCRSQVRAPERASGDAGCRSPCAQRTRTRVVQRRAR